MERAVVALVLIAVAVLVALVLERRRPQPPTRVPGAVPTQLDRDEFARPAAPWLVAVFTSATCDSCAGAWTKAQLLASADVEVQELSVQDQPDLHRRYRIDAVPTTVVADGDGVVVASFVGPPTATDLWAAVAEARQPGSTPEPDLGRPRPAD